MDAGTIIVGGYRKLKRLRRHKFMKLLLLLITLTFSLIMVSFYNNLNIWLSEYQILIKRTSQTDRTQNINISTREPGNNLQFPNTSQTQQDKGMANGSSEVKTSCMFPDVDPFDPAIIALIKYFPPITCEGRGPHLVYLSGDTIKVNHSRTSLVGDINNTFKECRYKSLAKEPGSDFKTVILHVSDPFTDSITLRDNDDNLVVECYGNNNTVLSRSYFSLIRIKKDLELLLENNYQKHVGTYSPKETLSVLMIGMDGNSKQNFQRLMPKTRNFLLNDLNAIELHRYNKIHEHTYTNIIPLLTGKLWDELHCCNWTLHKLFDYVNHDFIWSDFHKAGYRTGILFDDSSVTAFHFQKKGWDKPPADYYFRATLLEIEKDKLNRGRGVHCIGDIPEITFNHDFWIQMASTFNNSKTRPYFGFSFSVHLTHDYHYKASGGDHLYHHFLQELKDKNIINNTVLIFFSDHGQRFGETRYTYNGMIESRTPYVFLVFPPWFHRKYPHLIKVLKINQHRLTTNRDIYETLRDIVNFQATTKLGDINKRGISLFQEIPRERMCEHAKITAEYCVCNSLRNSNISSGMTLVLALTLRDKLQEIVYKVRDKCSHLRFKKLISIMEVQSNTAKVNQTTNDLILYQITIMTTPGDAVYEAVVQFSNSTKVANVVGDIIRLNMYRGQAECVQEPRLRNYCFCRPKLT